MKWRRDMEKTHVKSMLQHDTFFEGILDSVESDSEKCETIEGIADALPPKQDTEH